MINRNRTQTQYVFNSKTGMLEKAEDISKIPKAAAKKAKDNTEPVTSIMVVTSEDNLIHNYFYSFETSWDDINCLQMVILKMPKMGQKNIQYWANYTGQLTVYMGYNFTYDKVNSSQFSSEQEAAESVARYWDNSDVKPYFRGEVDKIKEYKSNITIYVKNIGARFQQKIPEDFRQAFIYNQNVRDSFVAMCEFLGVQYICPPQTVTEEAGEETTDGETENDGTENDVGQQLSTSQHLANRARQQTNSSSRRSSSSSSNNQASNLPNSSAANSEDSTEEDTEEGMEVEVNDIMNGYDDISFDANGAITHSSAVIEESPNMAHTLVAMEENPLEKYLDDETGIVEKVQNFLNGEMFDELHNNVMNYDSITIEPQAASSSDITTTGTTTGDTSSTGDSNSSDSSSSGSSSSGSSSPIPQPSARAIRTHRKSDAARIYEQNIAPLKAAWKWLTGG